MTGNATRARPGDLITNLFDSEQQSSIHDAFHGSRSFASNQHRAHEMASKGWDKGGKGEDVIREFCERIKIGYEPVSELNTSTSVSPLLLSSFFHGAKSIGNFLSSFCFGDRLSARSSGNRRETGLSSPSKALVLSNTRIG